jgi:hypothetical protein
MECCDFYSNDSIDTIFEVVLIEALELCMASNSIVRGARTISFAQTNR